MKKIFKAVLFMTISALCLQAAYARENIGTPGHRVANSNRVEAQDCRPASSSIDLDINNVRAELLNGGDMWWDLVSAARYEIPFNPAATQRGPSSLFAGSVWVGGIDQGGQLKVAAATYRQNGNDFFPGPLDGTGSTNLTTCNQWDHHYQVFASDIVKRDSLLALNPGGLDAAQVPQNMLNWPAAGNLNNPMAGNRDMAPFYDVNGDGQYDPTTGDYPSIYGIKSQQYADQMIWWVYNDKGNIHSESGGEAIGLEVHTLAFAFRTNDVINDMTFYRYTLFNRATTEIDSTYMGQWTDPDLGCYTDDYIACDVSRSMGIVYNASAFDGGKPSACVLNYGNQPPFMAIDYFKGPLDQHGKQLGMSSFLYYNNDFSSQGNPQHTSNYYGYLSGSWIDGSPFTQGGDAYGGKVRTKYVFPDAPNLSGPSNWSECNPTKEPPGDRRMVQASGPFKLEPGATNEVVIGAVWVRPPVGTYPCPSFDLLDAADDKAQALFNSNFKILNGPDAPTLTVTELDQKLIIQLVNTNTPNIEGYSETDPVLSGKEADSTYKFQGYQVYQLVNATVSNTQLSDPSQARLVFQCDVKDSVSTLINFVFNTSLNASEPIQEVVGANQGIKHSFEITTDAFSTGDAQLANFQQYYFLAISYAYNNFTDTVTHTSQLAPYLAGRRNIKVYTGIPHKPAPENGGLAIHANYGDGPEITRQEGGGNGGNWVQLTDQTVSEILANSFTNHARYKGAEGPVIVKVIDPKNVISADFELRFRDTTIGPRNVSYRVKDTSICSHKLVDTRDSAFQCRDTIIGGVHARVGGHDSTFVDGGDTITVVIGSRDTIIGGRPDSVCKHLTVGGHDSAFNCKTTFKLFPADHKTSDTRDTILATKKAPTTTLDDSAGWSLRIVNGDSVVAERSIGVGNEQVIPDWGLSVYIQQVRNPGSNNASDNNGFIGATISYANTQQTWLSGIANQQGGATFHWIRAGRYRNPAKSADNDYSGDTLGFYANILGATWAPYNVASRDLNFGPAYPDALAQGVFNRTDSLNSVDIVFTSDPSKWTRCIVVEANPESNLTEGNVVKGAMRQHASLNLDGTYSTVPGDVGFSWFPGYAIDPDKGNRLNILFAEDSRDAAENGSDMIWNPTSDLFSPTGQVLMGGRHYIYIMRSRYDGDEKYKAGLTSPLTQTGARNVYKEAIWTTMPMLAAGFKLNSFAQGLIPTTTTIQIRVNKAYQVLASDVNENNFFPRYTFSTSDIATTIKNATIAKNALDTVNVVPNPYYGYAGYETNQLDNRVRITNLPPKCEITIYTLSGTLVKKIARDDNSSTYFDWDLKNNLEVPIASGVYLIHVNADGIGEVTLKWFGVMRPIDLSSF